MKAPQTDLVSMSVFVFKHPKILKRTKAASHKEDLINDNPLFLQACETQNG